MKPIAILSLLLILSFSSCKKVKLTVFKENEFLKGKYEWVYSYGPNNESESFETVTDRYAMKFKRSGTVEIYKNGERVSKGYVSSIDGIYNDKRSFGLVFDDKHTSAIYTYTGETITYNSFPIADHTNIFQKQ